MMQKTYLKECKRVSAEVLHTYPNVCDNYDDYSVHWT